ncbi:MAG: queuosine precursor transporter [Opitutales bacterium]
MSAEIDPRERKFLILLSLYVGFWGMLQLLTVKLVPLDLSWLGLGVLAFSYGSFAHAFTFPCTDAVAEVWGARRARLMVYLGMAVYASCTILLYIATMLPSAAVMIEPEAYTAIFQGGPRIIAGSMLATVFAQLWDIHVFEWIKKRTGPRLLWLRNNLSTWGSQLADTTIFYAIAFYGVLPTEELPRLILGTYLLKVLVASVDTPIVYGLVRWINGSWTARGDLSNPRSEQAAESASAAKI